MKSFSILLISILLLGTTAFAQSIKKVEPQEFWQTNITAIMDGDVEQVVRQSHFPMSTFDGDWSKNDFRDAFEILFDKTTLAELNKQTYRDIQSVEDSPGVITYMVVIVTETEEDGEVYESATILSFKKFDGEWKLYNIDMAG